MRISITDVSQVVCQVQVGPGVSVDLEPVWEDLAIEVAVVADARVLELHGDRLLGALSRVAKRTETFPFPAGERHKTRATKVDLEDRMLAAGISRAACVVALGGGVAMDLGGFVAATYMRGVPWVAVPTSLLAQVDASIGGKTGVDTDHGKNLVGAFHLPRLVLADPELLVTLPAPELGNGLTEMVKIAAVVDSELFATLEALPGPLGSAAALSPDSIRRSVERKAEVVSADLREGGARAILNFGHTVGHALEQAAGYAIPHGQAVAVGMVAEAEVARRLCGLPAQDAARIGTLVRRLGLYRRPALPFDALVAPLGVDKKGHQSQLHVSVPRRIGQAAQSHEGYLVPVSVEVLRQAWEATA